MKLMKNLVFLNFFILMSIGVNAQKEYLKAALSIEKWLDDVKIEYKDATNWLPDPENPLSQTTNLVKKSQTNDK